MEKIKPIIKNWVEGEKGKDILTVMIVILVSLASFGLGRLSNENTGSGVKIEYSNQEANAINAGNNLISPVPEKNTSSSTTTKATGNYFASSRGKKYYSIGCSAGKTIKQENRVYFATSTEAEKAGYTLSSACQ